MTTNKPLELNAETIDMEAALQQGRVFADRHSVGDDKALFLVVEGEFQGDLRTKSQFLSAWLVDVHGTKEISTYPSPISVYSEDFLPIAEGSPEDNQLRTLYPVALGPAKRPDLVNVLSSFVDATEAQFVSSGFHQEAEDLRQFRSFLQRYGLPKVDNQMALLKALSHTTEELRTTFAATCARRPFPRGSECDNKLQAICEGDIALKSVGERDNVWTSEKAAVAARQGWRIEPAQDGTLGLAIQLSEGSPFATDIDAYTFVCQQAKDGDLLAVTACRAAGIQLAAVNDYRPPALEL